MENLQYLTAEEAAQMMNVSIRYLAKLRACNAGPNYVRAAGILRYQIDDIKEYYEKMKVITKNRWPANLEER